MGKGYYNEIRLDDESPKLILNLPYDETRSNKAILAYIDVLKKYPQMLIRHIAQARQFLNRGDVEDAYSHLLIANQIDPNNDEIHLLVANAYATEKLKKHEEAKNIYEKLISKNKEKLK